MPTILDTIGAQMCTISYGKEASFAGKLANVTIQVTPMAAGIGPIRLVWAATGDIFSPFTDSTSGDTGAPGIIALPRTDQDGFRHGSVAFKNWYYKAAVTATLADGQQLSRTYQFQTASPTLDLDLLDENGVVAALPVLAPISYVHYDGTNLTQDGTIVPITGGGGGGAVASVAGRTGAVVLTKSDVNLSNVDNTSDTNKPVSTAQAAINAAKADLVAGIIPTSQIPALALTTAVPATSQAAMLALTTTQVQPGDIAVRSDGAGTFILTATDPTQLSNWTRLNAPTDVVTSVNGQQGTVVLAKTDVGLTNVDNTADTAKPVSTAQATAIANTTLNLPVNVITPAGASVRNAVIGARNSVDASSGPVTVALPTPTAVGQHLILERADTSNVTANLITVTGTIRNAPSTVSLAAVGAAYEGAIYISESLTSWAIAGSIKPRAVLDAAYDAKGTAAGRDLATRTELLRITAKGDSITLGAEDGTGISWPDLLERSLPGVTVINNGQGGYTSTEVGITDGAIDVTVAGFTIPASTATTTVTVTAPTGDFITGPSGLTYAWTGTLAGVTGTLRHDVSTGSTWTFAAATAPGTPVTVTAGSKFHCTQNDDKTSNLAIIAVGRNNYQNATTIVADVNAMIARLSSTVKRYLVLGITTQVSETTGTGGNTAVIATNTALAAAFGNQYIDVRSYLMTSGLTFNNLTPSTADTNAINNGTIPPALMYTDGLHPNRYGYRAMTRAILDRLTLLAWRTSQNLPVPTTPPVNIYPEPGFEGGRSVGMTTNLAANGTMAVNALAARTGRYGLRATITGTISNPQVVVNIQLLTADANIAHAASIWVRPSKTVTVTPYTNYFDAGYTYLIGDTGTAQNCTAGVWTKVVIPVGNVPTAAGNYQLVVQANGSYTAGDIIDFDDVQVVAGGTTTPDPVTSVAGRNGDVVLTKTDVGLANVTNTADASKPVSTAQATAITAAQSQVVGVNTQTASYTTVLADAGKLVVANSTSAVTFTIPTNATAAYPIGTLIALANINTGALTIAGASGATVNSPAGLRLTTQYAQASLVKIATDTWLLSGQTIA